LAIQTYSLNCMIANEARLTESMKKLKSWKNRKKNYSYRWIG